MKDYMVTYYWAYTEEALKTSDTRGMSFFYTTQSSYQDAYEAAARQIRIDHGSNVKYLIVSITDQTATQYLSTGINTD